MEELQYLKEKSQFSKFVRCDIIMTINETNVYQLRLEKNDVYL